MDRRIIAVPAVSPEGLGAHIWTDLRSTTVAKAVEACVSGRLRRLNDLAAAGHHMGAGR